MSVPTTTSKRGAWNGPNCTSLWRQRFKCIAGRACPPPTPRTGHGRIAGCCTTCRRWRTASGSKPYGIFWSTSMKRIAGSKAAPLGGQDPPPSTGRCAPTGDVGSKTHARAGGGVRAAVGGATGVALQRVTTASPALHVSTVQPDRIGPAAWIGQADVDGLA
jgi:hypothetical protein